MIWIFLHCPGMIKMLNRHDRHAYTARTQRAHAKNPGKGGHFGNATPASDSQYGLPLQTAYRTLPGTPDLVFPSRRAVIFMHRCFWHRHQGCHLARMPNSRVTFWTEKLKANKRRDEGNTRRFKELGWRVLVIWECQMKAKDLNEVSKVVRRFLSVNPCLSPSSIHCGTSSSMVLAITILARAVTPDWSRVGTFFIRDGLGRIGVNLVRKPLNSSSVKQEITFATTRHPMVQA